MEQQEKNDVVIVLTGRGLHARDMYLAWRCVGCHEVHQIQVDGVPRSRCWEWDHSKSNPTISPSILTFPVEGLGNRRCHLFITLGIVRFCPDSDHEFAGYKIRMIPENANPYEVPGEALDAI